MASFCQNFMGNTLISTSARQQAGCCYGSKVLQHCFLHFCKKSIKFGMVMLICESIPAASNPLVKPRAFANNENLFRNILSSFPTPGGYSLYSDDRDDRRIFRGCNRRFSIFCRGCSSQEKDKTGIC